MLVQSQSDEQNLDAQFKLKLSTPSQLKQKINRIQLQIGTKIFYQKFNFIVNQQFLGMTYQQKQQFYYQALQFIESWQTKLFFFQTLDSLKPKDSNQTKFSSSSQPIKMISHIKFQKLQKLQLINCNITSIQPQSWIHCPNLIYLNLAKNKIHNLKSLSKLNLTNLNLVSIVSNMFSHPQLIFLTRINVNNSVFFSKLYLNGTKINFNLQSKSIAEKAIPQDLTQLFKFPVGPVNKLVFACTSGFATQKFKQKLHSKVFSSPKNDVGI